MKTKKCVRCQKRKRITLFATNSKSVDGLTSYCRGCYAEYHRERTYGVLPAEYAVMLEKQNGQCAICLKKLKRPHVDHNHRTGEVRGLLCSPCNLGIGNLTDSPLATARAVVYLLERGNYEGI